MTKRDAVKILMLSPFYFKLSLPERSELLRHFYTEYRVKQLPTPWQKPDQQPGSTSPTAWH